MFFVFFSFFLKIFCMILVHFFVLYVLRLTGFLNQFLFEQIIFVGILTGFVSLILLSWKKSKFSVTISEILLIVTLFVSLANFSLLNIDRSRSFYLLAWIDQSKVRESNSNLDLGMVLSSENKNVNAIQVRINEQVSRGLVSINGNQYYLTGLGEVYLLISNKAADMFDLENWRINSK
jgi:hypothetical protein